VDVRPAIGYRYRENRELGASILPCGTQQGEFLGMAPTVQPFTLRGMELFRIADSKIAELRRFFDLMAMLEQLGARSLPG